MIHAALLFLLAPQAIEDWADRDLPVRGSLDLWLDATRLSAASKGRLADGDRVAVWPDASGNHRDVAAAAPDFRPRLRISGGQAVVRFDGQDDRLSGAGPSEPRAEFTFLAVVAPHSNAGGFRALASGNSRGKNDYLTGFNLDLGAAAGEAFAALNVEGAGCPGQSNLLPKSHPMGSVHVVALTSKAGAGGLRVAVDEDAVGSRPRAESRASLAEIHLGSRHYSNGADPTFDSGFFHGDVAEVLLYGRVLSEAELRDVGAYLRKKHERILLGTALRVEPAPVVQMVAPGFQVKRLPVSLTNVNNVEYGPDGRLYALGYDGRIHVLVDADGDGVEETVKPFWAKGEGELRAPIGFVVAKEGVFVASKGKVSLVRDTDGDGEGDVCETVATGWQEIPHGVDTLGLARDRDGSLYFGLGCTNFTNAYLLDKEGKPHYDVRSERGTILKLSPDRSKREIVCTGIRFPVGLAINRAGDLFATDQEGETWLPGGNPLDELLHILPGRRYGFPPRHEKHLPDVIDEPAVVTFGPQHQSTCGLRFNEEREGRKAFGPAFWEGNALVVGESRGKLWRVPLVKTPAGYVGKPVLIGCQRMLTIDSALSPRGDLVLTCHSGLPDWGTGPKGDGALFKIVHQDRGAPQPVLAWPAGPLETRVAFDRPIDPTALQEASIVFGEHVTAGDRFEALRPPYKAVEEQQRCPRATLKVSGWKLSEDRRTLTLSTSAHPWLATYAVTLGRVGGQEIDLDYSLCGLEVRWFPEGKSEPEWSGWLPHPDLDVARALIASSAEHEKLLPLLDRPGRLSLRTKLRMPEGKEFTVFLESDRPIRLNGALQSKKVSFRQPVGRDPMDLDLELATGGAALDFHAAVATDLHPGPLPVRLDQLLLPWAPVVRPPRPAVEAAVSPLGPGGDWARGKALFFGDAKCSLCHPIRGEGGKAAPDLTNLVHWEPTRILREILEPSAAINPDYASYLLELRGGDRLAGVVIRDGADRVRILNAEAKETIVPLADIREMRPSAISLMPDGYKALGDDKLRDLLAYLMQEKASGPPARTRAEVQKVLDQATETGPEKPRAIQVVLVTGPKDHGPGEHDYPAWLLKWKDLLAKQPGVTLTPAFKEPTADQWEKADLMMFYFMDGKFWNDERYKALDAYLARGGGLVLLHSACIPEKEPLKLAERIGLAWEPGKTKFRHGELDLKPADHALTKGLGVLHLEDESYWPLVGDRSKVELVATAVEDGQPQPMLWTRKHEKGRVVGSLLGHYTWTWGDPLVRLLHLRAFAWACGEPVDRFKAIATDGVTLRD